MSGIASLKTLYFLGLLAEMLIRLPHERERQQTRIAVDHVSGLERVLIGLVAVGLGLLPAIYVFTPWLKWADYRLSPRATGQAGAVGSALLAIAVWIFWRSHTDLGRNWSPSLHPMYLSIWLWGIAQTLLLQNWVAGWASLILFLPMYILRVPREEQMMLEQFGEEYRVYMNQTGRISPRLGS
jgi:protein-S-isoprenylcysteine O-methyltransferase Ste14